MTLVMTAAFVFTNNRAVKVMEDRFILFLRLCTVTDNIQNIVNTVAGEVRESSVSVIYGISTLPSISTVTHPATLQRKETKTDSG